MTTTFAIKLPDAHGTIDAYLSDRGERDFPEYAARFATEEEAGRMLDYCERGAVVVEHPGGDDDD